MAENRLIGDYPVIGIRPTIDGRRGPLKVRESLEDQTMAMANAAAKLISENLKYSTLRSGSFKGVEVILPRNIRKSTDNGWFGKDHPKYATEEWGKEMLCATAEFITQLLDEIKKLPLKGEEK